MHQNKWTRGQPELARRVQQFVRDGRNRKDIAKQLGLSRYMVDRLRGGTEPEGGVPMGSRSGRSVRN